MGFIILLVGAGVPWTHILGYINKNLKGLGCGIQLTSLIIGFILMISGA